MAESKPEIEVGQRLKKPPGDTREGTVFCKFCKRKIKPGDRCSDEPCPWQKDTTGEILGSNY